MAIFIPGIKVLMEKLVSYTVEGEFRLVWNSKEQKEKLKASVKAIHKLLDDAEKRQLIRDETTIERRLQNLEAAAFEADYVFEELAYELVRRKVKGDKHRFADFFFSPSVNPMGKIAVKVEAIHKKVKQINEMASAFSLPTRSGNERDEAPTTSSTNIDDVGEKFVGREKDVMKLVNMVTGAPTEKEVISTLSIVGMGGLGKSTLARRLLNDERIISHFQERMWVQAPRKFNGEFILKNILDLLAGGNNIGVRNYIEKQIKENLKGKRYLLVLDDVWILKKDTRVWDMFMNSLKAASYGTGNVILITTRITEVKWIKKPIIDVHELGVLSDEECWSIIRANADLEEDCDPEVEVIGKQIAARCGGLPLAADVTGCMLRCESKRSWLNIERDWKSDVESSVSRVLRLSFVDHLDHPAVKKCFAYCAIIPKGGCVGKAELIQLWMAEGILNATKEDDGERILNRLIKSSLLQVRERDKLTGDVKTLGMHDQVADLALSLLHSGKHRRYVFAADEYDPSPIQNKHAAGYLRTIFLTNKFSSKELSKLRRVHTLILNSEDITELPDSIKGLIHLKYLDTSNTRIETLPESFGKLYLLETLRAAPKATGESSLRELPDSFRHLISLRHLYIPMMQLPPEMGKLTSLRTLEYVFPQGQDMDDDAFPALPLLANLTLTGTGANSIPGSLRLCSSLQNLSLSGFGIEALPDWLGSLPLRSLMISHCPKLSSLPGLSSNMAALLIEGCPLLIESLEVEPRNLNPEWSKISHIPNINLVPTS